MIQRFGLRTILAAPIIDSQGAVLAFFEVADKRGEDGFSEEDRRKLVGLSQIAAIAIKNAQLYRRQRLLSRQIVTAQEEERQRLSRELHDSVGQLLTALGIQLDMLGSRPEAAAVARELQEAAELSHQTHDEIRTISQALRPPTLELTGLNETLRGLSGDFARRTGLDITYQGTDLPRLPDGPSITFYRFLQETLANIARHARAEHVDVTLRYDEGELSLTVRDDGVGFNVGSQWAPGVSHGVGLLGLRERFELLEGELVLESRPGAGTTVIGRYRLVDGDQ
jgi:two-component system sensor histidine kinase UhpB